MKGLGKDFKWHEMEWYYTPGEETRKRQEQENRIGNNRLADLCFRPWPVGCIEPKGWLRRQLEIHAAGMGGQLDTLWPYIRHSRWIGGHLAGEKDPVDGMIYWLDGLIPMAWQLKDQKLMDKCRFYAESVLSRQREDGWLCPEGPDPQPGPSGEGEAESSCSAVVSDFSEGWAMAGMLKVLTQYAEATGEKRVQDAVEKALRFADAVTDRNTLRNWGSTRWEEWLISIYWLYERTHEEWLIRLARKLRCQGFDWIEFYDDEDLWPYKEPLEQCHWCNANHVVNNAMAVKTGPLYSRISGKKRDLLCANRMLDMINRYHGTVTGMFTGDENFSGQEPIQGSELCGVVELMFSLEQALAVTGDPDFADRLEKLAFNNLPATFDPKMTVHQLAQQVNQPQCSRQEWPVYSTNGPETNLFGIEPTFSCCTTQTQGWPKFIQSVFMKAKDGIAVLSYAPAAVTDGGVTVETQGLYPFRDKAKVIVSVLEDTAFALYLRIPAWAENAAVKIGDKELPAGPGSMLRIDRTWSGKTVLEVSLPAEYRFMKRPNGLSALTRGPLVFSLPIGEKWVKQDKPEAKDAPWLNNWEIYPTTPWNYSFVKGAELEIREKEPGEYPFSPDGAPVEIRTKGRRIAWEMEDGCAAAVPSMEWAAQETEEIRLIPYGCTCLRMTELPVT